MDDARRAVLLAELEDAKRERTQLDSFIAVMAARLGIKDDDDETRADDSQVESQTATNGLTDDPMSLVYANEFFGMKMPKAAEKLLERWSPEPYHRPMRTTDLMRALNKGGLSIKEPRVLYRSLYSAPKFQNLPGGQWGFARWYPNGVASRDKTSDGADADNDLGPADEAGPNEANGGEAGSHLAAAVEEAGAPQPAG